MKGTIFAIFIFLLVFSPLAFGTVEPWSYALMEILIFSALALLLWGRRGEEGPTVHSLPGIVPLAILLFYVLFQLLPLPPGLLKLVSPGAYRIYKGTLWAAQPDAWGPISLYKKATLSEFFRLASYAVFYLLTVQLLARREFLTKTVRTVAVFAIALSLFGMVQQFFWNGKIFWVRELTLGGTPYGPFVNRNHYAGLVDMLLPLVLCLFLYYRPRYSYISRRDRFVGFFSHPMTNIHILLGFGAVLIGTSVFLCMSRGGIISLCLSVVFLIAMNMNRKRERKGWILVVLVVVVVFYSVGWLGWEKVFQRFDSLRDVQGNISEMRLQIWKDSAGIMKDFPLTGTGFGSYISIYPKYRTTPPEGIVDHAHNDYIELFCNGGIIGAALFGWFLYSVLRRSYAVFLERRDRWSIYLFIGAVTGIVSILIHSLTDFNLHIGSNGLYLFFLLGLVVSASHTRMQSGPEDTLLGETKLLRPRLLGLIALSVLGAAVVFNAGILAAKAGTSMLTGDIPDARTPKAEIVQARDSFRLASLFDPLEATYRYRTANAEWFLSDHGAALNDYEKAVALMPTDGAFLQALGIALSGAGQDGRADTLLRSGISFEREDPLVYKKYALWLLSRGEKESAVPYLKSAIALEPSRTRRYITLLVLYGWRDSEIQAALPDMAGPHLIFADYLSKTGKGITATEQYRSAIEFAQREKETRSSYFHQAYRYFINNGLTDDALSVMRRAEELLPKDIGIKMALAAAYEKAGIPYRAEEEYRKVLVLDPGNRAARKKLEDRR